MAMFGKGKHSAPADLLNADVVHELETASKKKLTGALEVTDVASKQVGILYLFEGGLYAVSLAGYLPSIPDRLRVAGTITNDQAKLLTVPGSDWPSPLAGPVVVEQQWLTADALASLHQEYLVASLGAVTALARVKVKTRKGESTKDFCTLPLPVDPLFDTLRMRAGRLGAGWAAISPEGTPATIALESRHVAPPADMTLPEFSSLVSAVDGRESVDSVAYSLGLTRAEAVHMSMLLVRAGVLRVAAHPAVPARADRLLVPEAFGTTVPPSAAAVVPVPVPEPEPEPVAPPEPAAVPEPIVTGSPLLATSAVFAPEQAFGTAEPAVPPEAALEPVAVGEPPAAEESAVVEEIEDAGGDGSAPGWAAALLAAQAVSHSQSEPPPQDEPEHIPEPEPIPEPVAPVAALVAAQVPDEHVLMLRRELASSEVAELEQLLAKVTAEETDAISRASSVRARLNSAQEAVARIDSDLQRPAAP